MSRSAAEAVTVMTVAPIPFHLLKTTVAVQVNLLRTVVEAEGAHVVQNRNRLLKQNPTCLYVNVQALLLVE
jgi:uncharacterized protein (DUF697 family)